MIKIWKQRKKIRNISLVEWSRICIKCLMPLYYTRLTKYTKRENKVYLQTKMLEIFTTDYILKSTQNVLKITLLLYSWLCNVFWKAWQRELETARFFGHLCLILLATPVRCIASWKVWKKKCVGETPPKISLHAAKTPIPANLLFDRNWKIAECSWRDQAHLPLIWFLAMNDKFLAN